MFTMVIHGTVFRTTMRNWKTGETTFELSVRDNGILQTYICHGIARNYKFGMPVTLSGFLQGTSTFLFQKCVECTTNEEDTIPAVREISKNLSEKTAKKIFHAIGPDIFTGCFEENAEEKLIQEGVREETARKFLQTIRAYVDFRTILDMIQKAGGTYTDAETAQATFLTDTIDILSTTPYRAYWSGVPFFCCESLGKKAKIHAIDKERLKVLLEECLRENEQFGSTAIDLASFFQKTIDLEKRVNKYAPTDPFYIGVAILQAVETNMVSMYQTNGTWYLERKTTWTQESDIANGIKKIANGEPKDSVKITEDITTEAEQIAGTPLSDEQRSALSLLSTPGIKILTGGPGTGKTLTVRTILAAYTIVHPERSIYLCSPTASAAKRLQEATGYRTTTVHRLLGLDATGAVGHQATPIHKGLVICDEASFLDTEIFSILTSRICSGSILLLVGDEDQLESIGPGNIFSCLLRYPEIPVCKLTVEFRQGEDTSLSKNRRAVLHGDINHITEDKHTRILRKARGSDLEEEAIHLFLQVYDKSTPWDTRLISPVKDQKYIYGTWALNQKMQGLQKRTDTQTLWYGDKKFMNGDPVVFLVNRYERRYINGQQGIVKEIQDGKMSVDCGEEGIIEISGKDFDDIDLAYATTVHKMQGRECQRAIIIVPKRPISMLTKRMLYVSMTRAKENNIIISEGDALERAILDVGGRKRTTGLSMLLDSSSDIKLLR